MFKLGKLIIITALSPIYKLLERAPQPEIVLGSGAKRDDFAAEVKASGNDLTRGFLDMSYSLNS